MTRKQVYSTVIFGIIFIASLHEYLSNFKSSQKLVIQQEKARVNREAEKDTFYQNKKEQHFALADKNLIEVQQLLDERTNEFLVIHYVKKHNELPEYYITKSEARKKGWIPSQGNLCEVLPGKVIGGDSFGNKEGNLPKGEQYYEADVNYKCGRRSVDRIIFTRKGDVWLTEDHYKTFIKR